MVRLIINLYATILLKFNKMSKKQMNTFPTSPYSSNWRTLVKNTYGTWTLLLTQTLIQFGFSFCTNGALALFTYNKTLTAQSFTYGGELPVSAFPLVMLPTAIMQSIPVTKGTWTAHDLVCFWEHQQEGQCLPAHVIYSPNCKNR